MNLNAEKSRLDNLTKDISRQWEDTKNHWRDQKSLEFEKKYLADLFAYTDKALLVIEKLDEVLKKIRSDCE